MYDPSTVHEGGIGRFDRRGLYEKEMYGYDTHRTRVSCVAVQPRVVSVTVKPEFRAALSVSYSKKVVRLQLVVSVTVNLP